MHCPRCGQQQISIETKFCSRCGFQLGLVGELLINDGYLPRLAALDNSQNTIFTKKNGVVFSIMWFIFFTLMVTSFIGIAGGEELTAVPAIIGIFGSIMLLIISLVFFKGKPQKAEHSTSLPVPSFYSNPTQSALPPQQTMPASAYAPPEGAWRVPDTGDLVPRGSVTDHTTKLLDKDKI